jgi:hypothetical protein
MTNPIIKLHNIETDEVVEREMTNAEFDSYKAKIAEAEVEQSTLAAKENAKAAIYTKLGLTADEVTALLLGGN